MQGPCDPQDRTTCIYDLMYEPMGVVDEAAIRAAFGPRLRKIVITDDDHEFRSRVEALRQRLEPKFPAFTPSVMRQVVHHLQPVMVFERFFANRPEATTALFSISRQDLLVFKV